MLRKNLKNETVKNTDLCSVEFKNLYFMTANVEIKEMPEMMAVYCRHIGPFHLIGQAYGKLMQWAVPRGLYTPNVSLTATVTHDDPTVTAVEKIRQNACLIVTEDI